MSLQGSTGQDQTSSVDTADEWVPPEHKARRAHRGESTVDSGQIPDVDARGCAAVSPKWQAFGEAVLGFHRPVPMTAMCRCGQPLRVCDVQAQAKQYGLIPS